MGVVPEEAAYDVGSSMPGEEHVTDGCYGWQQAHYPRDGWKTVPVPATRGYTRVPVRTMKALVISSIQMKHKAINHKLT